MANRKALDCNAIMNLMSDIDPPGVRIPEQFEIQGIRGCDRHVMSGRSHILGQSGQVVFSAADNRKISLTDMKYSHSGPCLIRFVNYLVRSEKTVVNGPIRLLSLPGSESIVQL